MNHEAGVSMDALQDGQAVAIIGGGPGGVACAVALKNLAAETDKEIDVTLYEGKVFSEETHYNQCVGVLSPPIKKIVTDVDSATGWNRWALPPRPNVKIQFWLKAS
jgi:2-polyprenyl-6-methoxyphenol hydroxylase-like FAD-dependent oxidoreductase